MRATPVGAKAVEGGNAERRREIAVAYATRQWRVPPVASHLVMAGVGLRTVQDLLGHKTLAMTLRYSHLAPAHKATAVARLAEALASGPIVEPATAVAGAPAPLPAADPERFRNAPSGRQTPAKRKYVAGRRLGEWTRSQPIRTAAEVPLRFSLLETRPSFTYQRIAREAVRLRALGMPNCAIAVQLGVTDKTVAKACHWVQKGRVSAHSGR